MSDDLGARLVLAILQSKNLKVVRDAGITPHDIFSSEIREAFLFVDKYVSEKADFPTPKIVEEICRITLPDESEPLEHVLDLVRRRSLNRELLRRLDTIKEDLVKVEPDKAIVKLKTITDGLKLKAHSGIVSYKGSGDLRIKEYEAIRDGGIVGIDTPWESLTRMTQGWLPGQLHVVAAMANTGKTWVLCQAAARALKDGCKTLFVTLEMSWPRIARRLDAIRTKNPFSAIKEFTLDPENERAFREMLSSERLEAETHPELGDILFADKATVRTVQDVVALVDQYEPHIVFVDGGYRFGAIGGSAAGSWESTVSIVNDLQLWAERTNIPWVVSTQLGDSTETGKKKRKGDVKIRGWGVRYGKEWFINPDVVVGLYQDQDLRLSRVMELHMLKLRDGDERGLSQFSINWDMETMTFTEVEEGATVGGILI